ncbi:hypothetical protein HJ145_10230 [Vibrio parahaemolyticus]|nr:hypothetical protein [Vibrio parahaemolyticus]MBE4538530.1 hypothetical protein [Vibrio parahaemolyticus]
MEEREYTLVTNLSLFKAINDSFNSKSLTMWGGLMWFCEEFIVRAMKSIDEGKQLTETQYELTNKLNAVIVFVIANCRKLKLADNDYLALGAAKTASENWCEKYFTEDNETNQMFRL